MTTISTVARAQSAICPGPGAPSTDREHPAEPTQRPGPRRGRRYPLANLRRALRDPDTGDWPNNCQLARRLGVHVRQVQRWRSDDGLTERWADRAAIRAGLHPSLVWSDWWDLEGEAYWLTGAGLEAVRS